MVSHLFLPRSPFVNVWVSEVSPAMEMSEEWREREREYVGNPMPHLILLRLFSPWPERYYRDLTRNPSPPLREILSSSYHSTIALLQLPAHCFITPWHLDPGHLVQSTLQVWRSSYTATASYHAPKTNSALINEAIPNAHNLGVMYEARLASGRCRLY